MSLINVSNLTFNYDTNFENIFENTSFQIDTSWKLGFIGRNGKGKTTFLKLLIGEYEYSGKITSSVNFSYFPFEINNDKCDTINILEKLIDDFELWKIQRELTILNVDLNILYRPFNTLSYGERTKVMIAGLFLRENNFLLIDEPTNHLDTDGRTILSNYLKLKKGFILVSHDRKFIDNCVDHIIAINKNNIEIQKGNFTTWFKNKELKDNYELAENEKLKKEIKKLKDSARRTEQWSNKIESSKIRGSEAEKGFFDRGFVGHKAAKMMKRSKSIEMRKDKLIEKKSDLLKNVDIAEKLSISFLKHYKKVLINISELSILYNNKSIFENINLLAETGDRIAVCGKNGSGKSSILKLINGENINYKGNIEIAKDLKISYIPQDVNYIIGNLKDFAYKENIDESLFKAILRKLDFTRVQFEKDMKEFSSGQKKKVLIAKNLCENSHLYIWDEPLNYIDIFSRIQIEKLILEHKPTIIFVEHDYSFIKNVSNKIVYL